MVDEVADGLEWPELSEFFKVYIFKIQLKLVVKFVGKIVETITVVIWFVANDLFPYKESLIYFDTYAYAFIEGSPLHQDVGADRVFVLINYVKKRLVSYTRDLKCV